MAASIAIHPNPMGWRPKEEVVALAATGKVIGYLWPEVPQDPQSTWCFFQPDAVPSTVIAELDETMDACGKYITHVFHPEGRKHNA